MYQYYGDKRLLQQYYAGMKQWIEYLKNELNKDGILVNQGLGEWVPPDIVEIEPDFVNTCYYYYCCILMAKVSAILENVTDKEYFTRLASKAQKDINRVFFKAERSCYSIGRQGADVFPLGFGIVEKNNINAVFNNLIKNVIDQNKAHFDTGILGTPLMLEVLTNFGRTDLAYTLMNQRDFPGFGYMIEKGATTIWETFQGDVSHSHPMFGSVCQWFYQYLGGISPDEAEPGFKHIIVKPVPVSSLSYASSSYLSQYGEISTDWKFEGEDYLLNVKIPANTTATIYVLSGEDENVTENGRSLSENPYVRYIKSEAGYAIYECGSGNYNFLSEGAKSSLKHTILSNPIIHPGDTLARLNDSILVDITSDVSGAKIYFTSDSTEPDTISSFFRVPFWVSQPTIIRAKAYLKGYESSFTKTNYIDFIDPEINGLIYKYYEGVWTKLPEFSKLPVVNTGTVYEFGLDKIIPAKDEFALSFEGKIRINRDGVFEFYIQSNDGSRLFIDNQLVIDHDGPHGADIEKSGRIVLTRGTHPLRLDYFQAGGGLFLRVQYSGPGIEKQDVPAMSLFQR